MKKQLLKTSIIIFSACILFLTGCHKQKEIKFDDENALFINDEVKYAVIIEPYAGYRKNAGFEQPVINEGRKGEIVKITGKNLVKIKNTKNYETWYKFGKGWLEESVIEIYDNKLKAKTASDILLSN